jgi:cholesterol transport system auxiliary component
MMRAPSHHALCRRQVLFSGAAMLVSGCALISGPKAPQLYVLRPDLAPAMGMGAPVRWRLTVASPDAPASLDTARIALTRSTTMMDYFANAAWTDRVPLMVQRMLIQAFDSTGRILSVDRDTAGLENDYLLETEIREFQAHYDMPNGAPQILVGIQVKLVRMPERNIVSGLMSTHQAQATTNSIDNIVVAFNQAAGAAISQIVGWTLNQPAPSRA